MSKGMSSQERAVRIELARARAALERQEVARNLHELRESLTPSGLWHSVMPGSGSRRRGSRHHATPWAMIADFSQRYPFLLTGASALLSTIGRKRKGWGWRLGLGALAGWKLLQTARRKVGKTDKATPRLPPGG